MISQYDDRIDKLYDKDFKPINFDYKKYVHVVEELCNQPDKSSVRSKELRKIISRDSFKHIPNGVYYFSLNGKTIYPQLLFRDFDILCIGCREKSDLKEDKYSYYMIFNPLYGEYVWYGERDGIIAFHDNYYYGIGSTTEMARDNLELNMFNEFRSRFLSIASKGKAKVK